jgi:hypothetical protein
MHLRTIGAALCVGVSLLVLLIATVYTYALTDECGLVSLGCQTDTTIREFLLIICIPPVAATLPLAAAGVLLGNAWKRSLLRSWIVLQSGTALVGFVAIAS